MVRIRNRQRLRRKEVADLAAFLESSLGCVTFDPDVPLDVAETDEWRVLLLGNEALGLLIGETPMLTVRGLIAFRPTKRYVTVDMGAVRFVYNGADIMVPGIVDADPAILAGNLVWIRDERNRRPLAVGEALMTGSAMIAEERGKAIRSIHHVGDDLWNLREGD